MGNDNIVIMTSKNLKADLINEMKIEIRNLYKDYNIIPRLAVIQIGDNPASTTYVRNKTKLAKELGIEVADIKLSENINIDNLTETIINLNNDKYIDGILLQQPIPSHLKGLEQDIVEFKDVDGFTFKNLGALLLNETEYTPCTTQGIIALLDYYKIPIEGKHIVIIGRSSIVGKPTAAAMLNRNATITICHSKTPNLEHYIEDADILVVAIGKPEFIDSSYLTLKTKVVIDVGINRLEDGTLCGDCDYNDIVRYWNNSQLTEKRYITPVPRWSRSINCSLFNEKYYKSGSTF